MRIAIIAITTSSSISVKPRRRRSSSSEYTRLQRRNTFITLPPGVDYCIVSTLLLRDPRNTAGSHPTVTLMPVSYLSSPPFLRFPAESVQRLGQAEADNFNLLRIVRPDTAPRRDGEVVVSWERTGRPRRLRI